MIENFRMFAAYNRWANALVYQEAERLSENEFNRPTGAFFSSLNGTLNHILVGDRVWMNRFTGEGPAPKRLTEGFYENLADLKAARIAEDQRIIDWVHSLSIEKIDGSLTYTPITTPEQITQKIAPAISHFFSHQTHHRGQAHVILTSLGRPSLALDLIYFLRTDEGKDWA